MTPRIEDVSVVGPALLRVKWKDNRPSIDINLRDWIATGGEHVVALTSKEVFGKAMVGNYGTAIMWDDENLAIDAIHLMRLANEQGHCAIP